MLRNLAKKVIYIIFIFAVAYIASMGGWCARGCKNDGSSQGPIIRTDTIPYPYPEFIDKPSFLWKLAHEKHTEETAKSITPVKYQIWMDSVWTALKLKKRGDVCSLWVKKNKEVLIYEHSGIPDDFTFVGLEEGHAIHHGRFSNPFSWTGIVIGSRIYYDRSIIPYIQTGIRIKRVTVEAGIDKNSIYGDVNFRLW